MSILPLVCVLAALGVRTLLSKTTLSHGKNITVFLLLAVFSLGLDIYHFDGPGQLCDWNHWVSNKGHFDSVDFSRAYPILESVHKSGRPLWVLSHLHNNNYDQTFNIASGPFDEAGHPDVLNQSNLTAALLVNCNYEPFLRKEFPESQWMWLSPELDNDYGGFALVFIPVNSRTEKILERWKRADEVFSQNNGIYLESPSDDNTEILKDLYAHYSIFRGDRFLESIFWGKVAYYEEIKTHIPEAAASLKKGIRNGYPAAQFYNQLGDLSAFSGNKEEAKGYFEKAMGCPVNRTTAVEHLKLLKTM
jgi:hypothetical protein